MRKKIALGGVVVAIALAAAPALSATRPGSIRITSLVANQPASGVVKVEWTFRSGTEVDSLDLVNAYASPNGLTWTKIADRLPIRQGSFDWDTSALTDAPYAVRLKVYKEPVYTITSPVFVDNTAPVVDIVRPAPNQLIVDETSPEYAIVAGVATLQAMADDALTGVETVTWFVDDEEIGSGATYTHNFGANPGPHTLKAVAVDFAGNSSEDVVSVLALPGPSALDGDLPTPPEDELPADPNGELPTPPEGELPVDPNGELPVDPNGELPVDPNSLPVDPNGDPTTLIPTVPDDPTTLIPDDLPVDLP